MDQFPASSSVSELVWILLELRDQRLPGYIILGCGALYVLLGILACARRPPAKTPVLAALLAMSAAGTFGGALAFIIAGRRSMLLATVPPVVPVDPDFEPGSEILALDFAEAISKAEAAFVLFALALLWTFLIGAIVLVRAAVARRQDQPPPSAAAIALTVLAAPLGVLLLARERSIARGFHTSTDMALREQLEEISALYTLAAPVTIAAAVLAAAIAVLLARRVEKGGAPPVRRSEKIASAGLLAAGLVAFLATRPHAADAAALLPYDSVIGFSTAMEDAPLRALPEVRSCIEWSSGLDGPWVSLKRDGATLDGWKLQPAELTKLLKNKRELWHQLRGGGTGGRLYPPPVIFAADRGLSPAALRPYIEAAQAAWPEAATLVGILPLERWESRTLGVFERRPRTCPVVVKWGAGGRSMSSMKSWQEVVSEAAAAPSGLIWSP